MLRFRILGPLEVERDGLPVEIAGQRQRRLLSSLLLTPNRLVTIDALVDRLWGDPPPATARTALHNAVSQLRKALGDETIETLPAGYRLQVEPLCVDVVEFASRLEEAHAAAPAERRRLLDIALGLWRGSPYVELRDELFAQGEIRRLEESYLVALENRIQARLDLGESASLVGELEHLVASHPDRERLRAHQMLALYRSGRQTEALDAYHVTRRRLVDELGIEPGRELQQLHAAVLRQDLSLDVEGAPRAQQTDHSAEVMRALLAGRLVPFLGPGVDGRGERAGTSSTRELEEDELATRLGEFFECPEDVRGNLTRVSQYVALTAGIGPLYDELHALLDRDYTPGPVHRYLATLPLLLRERALPPLVVATTSFDETLEAAFRAANEPFETVSYVAHGPHRGRFVHVVDNERPRVVDDPNADVLIGTGQAPVILKIHGCVDRRPAREWESFVVSEDDYIDYLASGDAATALPVGLAARLRRSHFLFLGYSVLDWNLRVFLRRMWGDERLSYRSWAVQPDPGPLTLDFWRHRDVDVLDLALDEFVAALERHAVDLAEVTR
jgi:DNA-binding SARP family transcriptional activator